MELSRCARRSGVGLLMMLTSCGGMGCDGVGHNSMVAADSVGSPWSIEEFCIDDHCVQPAAGVSAAALGVTDGPERYAYRLTLVGPDTTRIEQHGEVATRSFERNGAGCEPRTANASLVVGDGGVISVSYP